MPMIDIYAAAGTFSDVKKLASDAAALVKSVEQVPDIPMFRKNTAAFVHEMPSAAISNVDGDANYVRVQVLTNAGALDRDKQIALVNYSMVDSIEDSVERAVSLGAKMTKGKTAVPGMGWFAMFTDPEGNNFAVFKTDAAAK